MKKPKILFIGTTDNKGGAAQVSWRLSKGLIKKGYWVRQIVGYKYSKSPHIYQLKTPIGKNATLMARHLKSFILANDQDQGLDQQILNHPWYKKADIVHLQNTHGGYISLDSIKTISQQKILIWTMHDMWPITSHCAYTNKAARKNHDPIDCQLGSYPPILWDNRKNLWQKKLDTLNNSNITFISSSQWLLEKFKTTPLKSKNIYQIYNGINASIFKNKNKKRTRKKLKLNKNKKIALFVADGGRLNKRKGYKYFEYLSKIFKTNLFLVIGGDIDHKQKNIIFVPKISNKQILANYYNASDFFIFPSLADNNPQVVLEALSCKLPVLGFDACGTTELINHKKTGFLAKYKSKKELKDGLDYLINHKLPEKNFQKDFSLEKMVTAHEKLYKKMYD